MAIQQQARTIEEFLAQPEEKPAREFFQGEVTQKVSPQGQHSAVQSEMSDLLNRFIRPRRLARAFTELRATFGGASVVPDVSVYLWDRIPRTNAGKIANQFLLAPDIAVEILSPGQRATVMLRKCLWYVENGVRVALQVDPSDESVLAFRPGANPIAASGDDQIDVTDVLPGFQLSARELFAALRIE